MGSHRKYGGVRIRAASKVGGGASRKCQVGVTLTDRRTLGGYRTCKLVQIDFGSLAPNPLDPMPVGECLGRCRN